LHQRFIERALLETSHGCNVAFNSIPARIVVLVICNSPLLVGLGSLFFSSWREFFDALIPEFDFGFWSWVFDAHTRVTQETFKLSIFILLSIFLIAGEYKLIWSSSNSPASKQSHSPLYKLNFAYCMNPIYAFLSSERSCNDHVKNRSENALEDESQTLSCIPAI
jgi:hypothetical protein